METVKIVVWDNIGNTLLGVQPWAAWDAGTQAQLRAEDPDALAHAPGFADIFRDYDVRLIWLHDPARAAHGFHALFADHAPHLRDVTIPGVVERELADADILVVHKETVPPDALRGAAHLRLIHHLGQDYRGMPVDTAREMSIPVAASPLVNYLAVAEHTWAFILNYLKRLPEQRAQMAEGAYAASWGRFPGLALAQDCTLGLVGFGEIARPVARIARAFAMPVLYWDRERFPAFEASSGVQYAPWDDLFRRADIVSVHLALTPQTEGIIGAREFALMRPTALFINTARGKLVDQPALVRALAERRIGGAALDVYTTEPLPLDDPLHALHADVNARVTLTPHDGWQSPWTWVRDSQGIWFNVLRALRGEPITDRVDGAV